MNVRVLYFSLVRRITGTAGESVELPDGARVDELIVRLAERHPGLRQLLASLLVTRNEEWCDRDAILSDGDVVGLMPPVSGG